MVESEGGEQTSFVHIAKPNVEGYVVQYRKRYAQRWHSVGDPMPRKDRAITAAAKILGGDEVVEVRVLADCSDGREPFVVWGAKVFSR
jgi:hypothetical protein